MAYLLEASYLSSGPWSLNEILAVKLRGSVSMIVCMRYVGGSSCLGFKPRVKV